MKSRHKYAETCSKQFRGYKRGFLFRSILMCVCVRACVCVCVVSGSASTPTHKVTINNGKSDKHRINRHFPEKCTSPPKLHFTQNFIQYFRNVIIPLNAELNPICHLLALRGGATIVVVSRLRVNSYKISRIFHFINFAT